MSNCKICNGELEKSGSIPGYIEPEYFSVYYCHQCGASCAEIPCGYNLQELYDKIYSNDSNDDGYGRYQEYAKKIKFVKEPLDYLAKIEPQYRILESYLNKNIKKNAKILEIGSGLGYTTYSVIKAGYKNAIGCDISAEAVNKSKVYLGDYYYLISEIKDEKFDFIFALEVIEHIIDPEKFIDENIKKLAPGGKLLITTPRSITPRKKLQTSNNIWISDPPPVHLWCFTIDSLKIMGDKIGDLNMQELNIPLSKSLFKYKAVSYRGGHVLVNKRSSIRKVEIIYSSFKRSVKDILLNTIFLEDIILFYALLLKIIGRGGRYTFLKRGCTETLAFIYTKK